MGRNFRIGNTRINKMTSKTPSQRKRIQRNRYRAQGLVPVEVWVRPCDKEVLKAIVVKLNKG